MSAPSSEIATLSNRPIVSQPDAMKPSCASDSRVNSTQQRMIAGSYGRWEVNASASGDSCPCCQIAVFTSSNPSGSIWIV